MQSNSVFYILGFCAAVCLVCSVIVSATAVGLKEQQEFNKVLDRQKKVLSVAGLIKEGQAITPKTVRDIFGKRIKSVVVDLQKGKVDAESTQKAATFDQLKASKDPKTSRKAPKNRAGVQRIPNKALVYLVSSQDMDTKGNGFALSQYIFPVEGKGLWSTLYGYIALAPDFNTIKGLTFYQHAETPGLGGEVDNPKWKSLWPGRKVYKQNKVKIKVIKGMAPKAQKAPYKVDGLSGATITSNGVTHLLRFWMGDMGFKPYIENMKKSGGKTAPTAPAPRKAAPSKAPAPARRASAPVPAVRRAPAPVRKAAAPAPAHRAAAPVPTVRRAPAPVRRAPSPVRAAAPAPVRAAAPASAPAKPTTQPQPRKR